MHSSESSLSKTDSELTLLIDDLPDPTTHQPLPHSWLQNTDSPFEDEEA